MPRGSQPSSIHQARPDGIVSSFLNATGLCRPSSSSPTRQNLTKTAHSESHFSVWCLGFLQVLPGTGLSRLLPLPSVLSLHTYVTLTLIEIQFHDTLPYSPHADTFVMSTVYCSTLTPSYVSVFILFTFHAFKFPIHCMFQSSCTNDCNCKLFSYLSPPLIHTTQSRMVFHVELSRNHNSAIYPFTHIRGVRPARYFVTKATIHTRYVPGESK